MTARGSVLGRRFPETSCRPRRRFRSGSISHAARTVRDERVEIKRHDAILPSYAKRTPYVPIALPAPADRCWGQDV